MTKNQDAFLGKMFMEAMPRAGAGIFGSALLTYSAISVVSDRFLVYENPGDILLNGLNAVLTIIAMYAISFAAAGPELFINDIPDQTA